MVPSYTVELNKLMNELEISELEVSRKFVRAETLCRLCRSLSTRPLFLAPIVKCALD